MTFTAPRLRIRTSVLILLVLGLLFVPLGSLSPSALADSGMEASFVAKLNAERANNGLPALSTSGDLTSVARSWSTTMANQANLYHNPNLGSQVSGWQKVGENVGRGPSVDALHTALMNSPGHRANILGADWTQVGIGVVVKDGTVWVTQVFRQPAGAPKPAPAPAAKDEPKEEPKPAAESQQAPEATSGSSGSSGTTTSAGSTGSPENPTPAHEPVPEPEPHEVADRPLPMDRVTLMLARLEATDLSTSVDSVLAAFEG